MRPSMDSETSRSEQVEEAAVRWLMRRQSGTWSESDQKQLDAWLRAATAHRVQYLRATRTWEQTDRMKALGAGVPPGVVPKRGAWGDAVFLPGGPGTHAVSESSEAIAPTEQQASELAPQTKKRRQRWQLRLLSGAAAVLIVAIVYVVAAGVRDGTSYSTRVGGLEHVTLVDGSKLTLNTDTRIRVKLTEHERRIRLDRGEAFFEVAKDKTRPFVVYVGEKRVMAVGTKFSVRRDEDDLRVVVTEGRVKLATRSSRSGEADQGFAGRIADFVAEGIGREHGERIAVPAIAVLDAGAIVRTSKSEMLVRTDAQSEAEKLLSWRVGYVAFDNVPLAEAVAEFNRYSVRRIVIEDPEVAAILVGGNFRSDNTEAFLALLQSGFPISVEQRDDRVILRSR